MFCVRRGEFVLTVLFPHVRTASPLLPPPPSLGVIDLWVRQLLLGGSAARAYKYDGDRQAFLGAAQGTGTVWDLGWESFVLKRFQNSLVVLQSSEVIAHPQGRLSKSNQHRSEEGADLKHYGFGQLSTTSF